MEQKICRLINAKTRGGIDGGYRKKRGRTKCDFGGLEDNKGNLK